MARRGYANVQIAYEWVEAWNKAAGELAPRSRPGRYSRGVLEVMVQDSATLQELTFRKKQILTDMNNLAPQFTDHYFTGEYPTTLTDLTGRGKTDPKTLSLMREAS